MAKVPKHNNNNGSRNNNNIGLEFPTMRPQNFCTIISTKKNGMCINVVFGYVCVAVSNKECTGKNDNNDVLEFS